MIERYFKYQKEAVEKAGGYVHPTARLIPSEDGGFRFDCDTEETSLVIPSTCWRAVNENDFWNPRDKLIESFIELWSYCFGHIEDKTNFIACRLIDGENILPLMSWVHHSDEAERLQIDKREATLRGSFMRSSDTWKKLWLH